MEARYQSVDRCSLISVVACVFSSSGRLPQGSLRGELQRAAPPFDHGGARGKPPLPG